MQSESHILSPTPTSIEIVYIDSYVVQLVTVSVVKVCVFPFWGDIAPLHLPVVT